MAAAMTAKDPRKALILHLPAWLRPGLARARARGRTGSASAAMRLAIERALAASEPLCPPARSPVPPLAPTGPAYRLQLAPDTRARIAGIAAAQCLGEAEVVLHLLAAQWRPDATAPPRPGNAEACKAPEPEGTTEP